MSLTKLACHAYAFVLAGKPAGRSDIAMTGIKPTKAWMWSGMPFTIIGFCPLPLIVPVIYLLTRAIGIPLPDNYRISVKLRKPHRGDILVERRC